MRIGTRIGTVIESVSLLYGEHPVLEEGAFCAFYVRLFRPRGLRRWYRPQVQFAFDDLVPFKPLPLDHALPMLEWGSTGRSANTPIGSSSSMPR